MDRPHPYIGKPDYQFWANEPAIESRKGFDPVVGVSFPLAREEPIAAAGSCFAQHVSKVLQHVGFNFLVTEEAHPIIPDRVAQKYHYGSFTARYGNIYTARQLRQLLERAFGRFEPLEACWIGPEGGLVDPFRPQIHPGGFINRRELEIDRDRHLAAVRKAFESLSCFIFTLGLTEAWVDRRDGAVFPLAPGVAGGTFDPELFEFKNFTVAEVTQDLQWSFDFIRSINRGAKFIVTVSPVPLNATYLDQHVFLSSVYSKSVLRVAAGTVCEATENCDYFPSYEIVNNPYHRFSAFAENCREVTPEGVAHVMQVFLKHYADLDVMNREKDIELIAKRPRTAAKVLAIRLGLMEPKSAWEGKGGPAENGPDREVAAQQDTATAAAKGAGGQKKQRKPPARKDGFLEEMEELNDLLCDEERLTNR